MCHHRKLGMIAGVLSVCLTGACEDHAEEPVGYEFLAGYIGNFAETGERWAVVFRSDGTRIQGAMAFYSPEGVELSIKARQGSITVNGREVTIPSDGTLKVWQPDGPPLTTDLTAQKLHEMWVEIRISELYQSDIWKQNVHPLLRQSRGLPRPPESQPNQADSTP